jgi:hypothetical protein
LNQFLILLKLKDATRYIQCDARPGVYYIRNCPGGTVFDPRNSVCNYGYYYYGK